VELHAGGLVCACSSCCHLSQAPQASEVDPELLKSGLAIWFHSQKLGGDGDKVVIFKKSRHAHKVGPQPSGAPSQ
jgi:hypothetical protein